MHTDCPALNRNGQHSFDDTGRCFECNIPKLETVKVSTQPQRDTRYTAKLKEQNYTRVRVVCHQDDRAAVLEHARDLKAARNAKDEREREKKKEKRLLVKRLKAQRKAVADFMEAVE